MKQKFNELKLPKEILNKASKRGNEYAWKFDYVEEVMASAQTVGLATVGGQAQFRTENGTYEMYWISIDIEKRKDTESWSDFVKRSTTEFITLFKTKILKKNFVEEVASFKNLELEKNNLESLCFVIYLVDEISYAKL